MMDENMLSMLRVEREPSPDMMQPVIGDDLLMESPEEMGMRLEQEFGYEGMEKDPIEAGRADILREMLERKMANSGFQQKTNAENRMRIRENAKVKPY